VATTNSETSCGADPECANVFPPQCDAGGICGKSRLSSLSWRQLECWRRWLKFAELSGMKTDRTRDRPSNAARSRVTASGRSCAFKKVGVDGHFGILFVHFYNGLLRDQPLGEFKESSIAFGW
jgi:hypothetical protein